MKKNIKLILIIFAVILVAGGGVYFYFSRQVSDETVTEYENIIEEAELLYNSESYTKALASYDEAADLIPSKIDAFRGIINIFVDKGRLSDAEEIVLNSATKLSQSDKSILFSLVGNAYFDVREYDKALEMYDGATTLGITNLVANLGKAKVYLKQNKIMDAEKILSKGNWEEDTLYESQLLYAYTKSLSDTDSALEILEDVNPSEDWSSKYTEFGEVLESLGEDELFNSAKLARIYINEGYPYLAVSILSPLKDQMSEYPDGLYFLGRAYLDTGSVDTAITTLESAVSAGSLDPDLFRSIARAYYEKDDFDTAIEYYDRAVAYAGENIEESLLSEYMDFLIEENYLTQAQDLLDIAQKYFEETWVDIYAVEVNYLLKDNEKVDYYIEQGLEREDITTEEKKTILYWQARIAVEDGDLESAEDILADLKQLDRFNPFYYLLMGDVLYEKADFENAKTNYESAIEYDLGEGVSSEAEKALARLD